MKLHEDKELFAQAIRATAARKEILEIYVEKDYWVTLALHKIFNDEIGKNTVFKGGTALSKCFGLIKRFSEDIDLVVLRHDDDNGNSLKRKIKKIGKVVSEIMPEVTVEGLTHKIGMIRKTAHSYQKEFDGKFGQVRDVIVVEATWLGRYDPYHNENISSYIYEMMIETNQYDLAEKFEMLPFEVQVLDSRRTICEKIMSLVRFSYGENPIQYLKDKIRHTYDINQLLKDKDIEIFFSSEEFNKMFISVAHDDVESFKNNNKWLNYHPKEALLFKSTKDIWEEIKSTYNTEFKDLVYGEFPSEDEILKTLIRVGKRISDIDWDIKLEEE